MNNPPKTLAEAKICEYGEKGDRESFYNGWCAYEISKSFQCLRKPGHGPAALYCKQHARIVEKQLGLDKPWEK